MTYPCWITTTGPKIPWDHWDATSMMSSKATWLFSAYICVCWWAKGWPVVACPSRALVVLYRMLTIFACYVFDFYVWDAVSIFNHLPRMFLSTDFAFRITDWTCCHGPHLHAILKVISRGVSCLATDSPCGVWGRGWTTCLLHDSPLFGSHFKMRVGM